MRRVFRVLVATFLAAGPSASLASEEPPDLLSLDTAQASRGWEAVGRLNFADAAYCTGALIEEDIVLTAAHCLYDQGSGELFKAGEIEFLAGWRNGRAAAYRGVSRVVMHPDFTYSADDRVSRVAHDLALLQLDQPIRNPSIAPYEVDARPERGASVGVVSYARDRSEAASLQESCKVLARQGGVLVLGCAVDRGASGSPIFMMEAGEAPRIVSVVSAMAKVRDRDVALGTALTRPLLVLRDMLESEPRPGVQVTDYVSRNLPRVSTLPTVGGSAGDAGGGAKFLRPAN